MFFPKYTYSNIVYILQALYKEEFEKNKGKGFSVVVDTPEMQRLKKTQDQISNVSVLKSCLNKSWKNPIFVRNLLPNHCYWCHFE